MIYFLIQIVFEIPAGIIADKCSKKKTLLLSNCLFIISTLIFIFSNNYFLFLIAIIIKGIDNALANGIANSILYELTEDKSIFSNALDEIKKSKIILNSIFTSFIVFLVITVVEASHPEYPSKIEYQFLKLEYILH